MKKRTALIAALLAIIVAAVCIFVFVKPGQQKANPNSSRRDENSVVSMDEDLSAVDGSELGDMPQNTGPHSDKDTSGKSSEDTEPKDFNNPINGDVEQVQTVLIPEAMVVNPGDEKAFYENEDFKDVVPVDAVSFSAKEIPEKYDSRDVDGKRYVTEVKDQGYSYLCWCFACMGAVESDLLKHHEDIDYKDIDLSEKHLAYYNLHSAEGSKGGLIDKDYRELVNADDLSNAWIFDYDTGYITCGGVNNCCISVLTSWKGPVSDKDTDSFASIYGSSYLFTDNASKPSAAYDSEYHIQGVYMMPAVLDNNRLIKQMIMEHGAATVGINASSEYFKDHSSKLYSSFDGKAAKTADHEVLIVGWDDTYSASNFKTTPPGDGAWICRNSWGKTSGKEGFFYVSYYDETVAVSNAAAYNVARGGDEDWYDNNYQAAAFLNKLISTFEDEENTVTSLTASSNPYGMVYEAASDESLQAVGFMNLDLYQQYELMIYLNPTEDDGKISFEKSEPALTQKISAISGGFHTFPLEKALDLNKGDTFLILIKPATKGRLVYEASEDSTGYANYDEWQNFTGNIHTNYEASGCSYYISDDGLSLVRQKDKDFFVKAYTNNK